MVRILKGLLGAAILYFTIVWGFALLIYIPQDVTFMVALKAAHLLMVVAGIIYALLALGIALLEDW